MEKTIHGNPHLKDCSRLNALLDKIAATPAPIALGVAMVVAIVRILGIFWDNDIYYIIALGRSILTEGLPWTDPLTCNEGLACIAQQWVFCIGAAALFDGFGKEALCAVVAVLWAAAGTTIWAAARTFLPARPRTATYACVLAFLLVSPFVKTNPRMFDIMCLMICSIAMERYLRGGSRAWLAAPAACSAIMANVHCTMWVLAAIPPLLALGDGRGAGRRKMLAASVAGACAASMLSPYGIAGATYILLSLSGGLESIGIGELEPLTISWSKSSLLATIPVLVFAMGILRARQIGRLEDLRLLDLLAIAFATLALLQTRNVLLLAPFFAFEAGCILTRMKPAKESILARGRRLGLVAAAAMALLLCYASTFITTTSAQQSETARSSAVEALQGAGLEQGARIGNFFNVGGWLEVAGYRAFTDERAELLLPQVNGGQDLASQLAKLSDGTDDDMTSWISGNAFDALVLESSGCSAGQLDRAVRCARALGYELVYSDERICALIKE